jgi:fluoride exporter
MQKTFFIALAGLAGTVLRYWLGGLVARQQGETFPWGTSVVNLVGCFLAGVVFYLTEERLVLSSNAQAIILIGLLGGFTTFSSYGLQTFVLLRQGQVGLATINVAVSNVAGLLMVWAGYVVFKAL